MFPEKKKTCDSSYRPPDRKENISEKLGEALNGESLRLFIKKVRFLLFDSCQRSAGNRPFLIFPPFFTTFYQVILDLYLWFFIHPEYG